MKTLSIQRPLPSIEMRTPGLPEALGEVQAGELAALVGVEDLGRAVARQSVVESLDAEARLERVRHRHDKTFRLAQSITATR